MSILSVPNMVTSHTLLILDGPSATWSWAYETGPGLYPQLDSWWYLQMAGFMQGSARNCPAGPSGCPNPSKLTGIGVCNVPVVDRAAQGRA